MKLIVLSFIYFIVGLDMERLPDTASLFSLDGTWTVQGSTSQGYLNYDIELSESDDGLEYWKLSRQGNGSTKRRVIGFSNNDDYVYIKIEGDDGIGKFVSTYKLEVINNDFMEGTNSTEVESWEGLPGISYSGKITVTRN